MVVSELVTNAVLHARTEAILVVRQDGNRIRIEVTDGAPAVPVPKSHGVQAATGRGLHVVASLAADWAMESDPPGKRIWVELSEPAAAITVTEADLDDWDELEIPSVGADLPEPVNSGLIEVLLIGLPLALEERSAAHHDELLREFQLIESRSSDHHVPARLVALVDQATARFGPFTAAARAELLAARHRAQTTVDLVYRVPPDAGEAARRLAAVLDEADTYCRAGADLLTLAAPVEVVAYRDWVLDNFAVQAEGGVPRPWDSAATDL